MCIRDRPGSPAAARGHAGGDRDREGRNHQAWRDHDQRRPGTRGGADPARSLPRSRRTPGAGAVSYTHLDVYKRQAYDIAGACDTVRSFLDVLTNWYVRRSRDRFWNTRGEGAAQAREAMDTLYTCLLYTSRCV